MKKLIILSFCLLFISCASTNMPKENKADKKNVADKELPSWVNETPTSKDGLFSVGFATHKDKEFARKMAKLNAEAEMSKKQDAFINTNSEMRTVIIADEAEVTFEENTVLTSESNVDNSVIKDTYLIFEKADKKWICYLLLYKEKEKVK